ncbi:MAG: serine hydrolase [Saprospiraceae bacterium]|nr:serine hydrolase [Saprospiraceae bacterium]
MLIRRLLFLLILPNILFAQNPNPDPVIDQEILSLMQDLKMPGLSTVIVKDGEILWMESYGWKDFSDLSLVNDQTAFLIASVSKTYTATALFQLWETGAFQLDDPINDYLSFDVHNPNNPTIPITFRMLLTHTSTIKDNWNVMDQYYTDGDPVVSLGDFLESLLSVTGSNYSPGGSFYNFQPGSDYRYSNIGASLIGLLVEEISGIPFDQYCNEHIFEPLCMENTSWFLSGFSDTTNIAYPHTYQGGFYVPQPHFGFPDYPDGLLRTSITDVANYLLAYVGDGAFYDRQLVQPATIAEAWSDQIPDITDRQGLIWYQEYLFHDNGIAWLWGHNGGELGTTADIYMDPATGIGLAVLGNGEGDNLEICDLLYNLALNLNASGVPAVDCENISATEEVPALDLKVFPNPAADRLFIQAPKFTGENTANIARVELIDITGKTWHASIWSGLETLEVDTGNFPAGYYQILIKSAEGNMLSSQSVILLNRTN